jgi:hypothetical protein
MKHHRFYKWLERLLPLGAVITLVAFSLAGWVAVARIHDQRHANAAICRTARANREQLRGMLIALARNSRVSLRNDPKRQAEARRFYRLALHSIHPINCRDLLGGGHP